MNRFKFRVWDKEENKMVSPIQIDDQGRAIKPGYSWWGVANTYKHYPIMQYTGLKDKNGKEIPGEEINAEELYVRTSNDGNRAFFEYSTNGKSFTRYGPEFTLEFGKWTGDRLGFFCWNEEAGEEQAEGYLDVDWFHYEYDGPKAAN